MRRKDLLHFLIHLLFGLVFLSFPILASPDYPHLYIIFNNPMGRVDVIIQVLILGYFYLNFFYIIPRYFFKRKYFRFGLISLIFLFLLTAWIPFYFQSVSSYSFKNHSHSHKSHYEKNINSNVRDSVTDEFEKEEHTDHHHVRRFYMVMVNRSMYMFFFAFSVGLLIKITQKWRQSEKEKMNSELSYLKAQINPHFLFNTLNSIYALSLNENASGTSEAIIKLSSMMRYVTQEALSEKVSLEKELEYIRSYIELQRLRFGDTVKLNIYIEKAGALQKIAPLILISFIENAFKYGVNPQENSEIFIKITIDKNVLRLIVNNNKVLMVNEAVAGSGVGIQNTINRLNLLYDGYYELHIDDKKETYNVDLKLILS